MHKARHQRKGNDSQLLSPGATHATSAKEKNVGLVAKVACYLSFFIFGLSACAFITLHFHQAAENEQLQQSISRKSESIATAAARATPKRELLRVPEMTPPVEEEASQDFLPKTQDITPPSADVAKEQDEDGWSRVDGYIPSGGDLVSEKMTVTVAKIKCRQHLQRCQGFCHAGPPTDEPVVMYFKSSSNVLQSEPGKKWTTFLMPEDAAEEKSSAADEQEVKSSHADEKVADVTKQEAHASEATPSAPSVRITRSPRKANVKVDFTLDKNFHGYALIPRPVLIKPLSNNDVPFGAFDISSSVIRLDVGILPMDEKVEAMLAAYRDLLGLHVQRADLSKESQLGPGSVAVVVRDSAKVACAACAQLVGQHLEDEDMQPLQDAKESEWHFAILSDRRLVVCAVTPEGGFRFAATLRQMLYAIPRSRKSVPMVTSQTTTTSMVTSQSTVSSAFQASSDISQSTTTTASSQTSVANKISDASHMEGYQRLMELQPFVLQDWPHFEWRGLQLDCVRHFMPMPFLKRYLQAMAYYKANVFHWHLTDDQAWRVFIPKRPKLVNASATPGFYSTADVHTIVAFAAGLFIKVIPVIETPGHSLVSLAAYPELACEGSDFKAPLSRVGTYDDILCVAKRETENFARDVFAEIARLFPFKFVHIGGDEIPTIKWQRSQHVKAFAGMLGLKNLQADILEAWYCFLGSLLKEHGRSIVMWDDHFVNRQFGVSKLCPGAEEDWVVQAWRMDPPVGDVEKESIAASFPFRSISSSMKRCYLDYPVASIDFNKTVSWRPGQGNVMGGCANMWTEDSDFDEVGSKVYPRYLGLADRMWDGIAPDHGRDLDLPMYVAAQMHCNSHGPLLTEFNFSCGRFEIRSAGRSEFWKHTSFSSTVDAFDKSFIFDRALDEDPDTYFWGISPKRFDTMDVYWLREDSTHGVVVGKCLNKVIVATGSKDRPGDQLDNGELLAAQWLHTGDSWKLEWAKLAVFAGGTATADQRLLLRGPVVGLRIKVTVEQTKWITIPEIDVTECEASDIAHLPRIEDLPDTSPQSLFGSGGGAAFAFGRYQQPLKPLQHPAHKASHGGHGHGQKSHSSGQRRKKASHAGSA